MKSPLRRKLKGTNSRPFTVYLPDELDLWLRNHAHEHGRTLSEQTARVLLAGREVLTSQSIKVA